MRILHVGNGNQKHCGARFYDVGSKLTNGLIRNGHDVYFLSDRDTARAAPLFPVKKWGEKACNDIFLDICRNFQPDMILLGHADLITTNSLWAAKDILPQVRIAQFNVDPVFRPHNVAQILSKAAVVDATFITTAGPALSRFHTDHGIVAYIPNPVDPSMESLRCHEHTDQPHSVFWAHRYGKAKHQDAASPRTQYPLFLERAGVDIDYYGMNGKPELYGQAYFQAIAQAKMGLNLSITKAGPDAPEASEEELYLYASDRISHYMGCGLLTLTTNKNHLEDLFTPDEEIIVFETVEELLEKVRFYSQNDTARQRIAAAGWQKSHTEFNSTLISRYMVEQTFRAPLSAAYQWPTEVY